MALLMRHLDLIALLAFFLDCTCDSFGQSAVRGRISIENASSSHFPWTLIGVKRGYSSVPAWSKEP